jgi:hypothetical protein
VLRDGNPATKVISVILENVVQSFLRLQVVLMAIDRVLTLAKYLVIDETKQIED